MLWLGCKGEKEVCEPGDPGWGEVAPEGAEGQGGRGKVGTGLPGLLQGGVRSSWRLEEESAGSGLRPDELRGR